MSEILREVEGFKILKPIYISVVEGYGVYNASVPVVSLHAPGNTSEEAICSLQRVLGATYRSLSNSANLNKRASDQLEYLRAHITEFSKDNEIEELRKHVADVQSGVCIYCGLETWPGADSSVLTAHMEVCPKHPLATALRDAQELRDALAESRRVNRELSDRLYDTERFHND